MTPGTAALLRVGDSPAVKEDSVIEVYGVADGHGKGVILRLGRGGPGMRIDLDQAHDLADVLLHKIHELDCVELPDVG